MATLGREFFRGSDIAETDINTCELENTGESVEDVLKDAGWSEEQVAAVLLHLGPDNERVDRAELTVRGKEDRSAKWEGVKLWPKCKKEVTVTIHLPQLDSWTFQEGGLTSDIIEDEELVHYFHSLKDKRPSPILQGFEEWGIGRFCARMVAHPSLIGVDKNEVGLKYCVLLYPTDKEALLKMSENAKHPSWPGLKLADGELRLLPQPSTPWGCPILPLILPAAPFEEQPNAPNSRLLRAAIGGVMTRCGAPDISRSAETLLPKWTKLTRDRAAFKAKTPPLSWPANQTPAAQRGR